MTGTEEHTRHIRDEEYASEAVLRAVAAVANQPLLDLPPLQESIDTDSLDRLFASSTTVDLVRFRYEGYEITIEPEHVRIHRER